MKILIYREMKKLLQKNGFSYFLTMIITPQKQKEILTVWNQLYLTDTEKSYVRINNRLRSKHLDHYIRSQGCKGIAFRPQRWGGTGNG